jgi:hypothetical protein
MTQGYASLSLRRRVVLAIALGAALLGVLAVGGAASAATPQSVASGNSGSARPDVSQNFKAAYKKTWTFKSKDIGVCVVFTATGTATYTVTFKPGRQFGTYTWSNQELDDPSLVAVVYHYARGTCKGSAKATGMDMGQSWTGWACSYNPSLSISVPWALSFGFWPSCGQRDQVDRRHYYSGTCSSYKMYNSGDKASFGNYTVEVLPHNKPVPPCYGVYVGGTVYEGDSSDSYASSAQELCLSQYY